MPRNTRTSQASASREKPIVLSGDEDGVAPPRRLDEEVYEQLREIQRSFTKDMYDFAVAYLQRTLERTPTEGIGDCWLLTIMAGFEVKDRNHVASLRDDQREDICTKRRRAIVEWAGVGVGPCYRVQPSLRIPRRRWHVPACTVHAVPRVMGRRGRTPMLRCRSESGGGSGVRRRHDCGVFRLLVSVS